MLEPKNIIRYYTCWMETLDEDEIENERKAIRKFMNINQMNKSKSNNRLIPRNSLIPLKPVK